MNILCLRYSNRENLMKKHFSTIILVTIFLIGLCVLLYPSVSNYINKINATMAVGNYDEYVDALDDETCEKMLKEAKEYNNNLLKEPMTFIDGAPKDKTYSSLLDVAGDGIMGYITIKKLGVNLPIYHGTSDEVLAKAVGHIEGSSLPVGGESTHAVISGHRGLPAAKLFTDLDKLEVGDTFTIKVLKETLTYEVDEIKIVLPEEISGIGIVPEKDYVTLVTCTPYAVNTHRLLVRAKHVETDELSYVPTDAVSIGTEITTPVIIVPIFAVWMFISLLSSAKRNRKKR